MKGPEHSRHERRHHFRGKARTGHDLGVRFRAVDEAAWTAASARDVGAGGAFIVVTPAREIGTEIVLELVLPTSDQVFTLSAVVRWTSPEGMGVQFTGEPADVLLELTDYFATLTA
ncbi:MAG TPA: PilZ domain-containing protein [Kofleriaceae bacterium]|nr:PilZ domain-containing protein [Kofleriaceae bacterium]